MNTGLVLWLVALTACLVALGVCAAWPKTYRAFSVVEPGGTPGEKQRMIQSTLARVDAHSLSVREVPGTALLEVIGRSADPRQAAALANAGGGNVSGRTCRATPRSGREQKCPLSQSFRTKTRCWE